MATRVSENPEVDSHYATQVALSAALFAALRRLWPQVNPLQGDGAAERYRDGVAALVEQFSAASISLSADFYEGAREDAGITSPINIPIVDTPPRSLVDAGVDWAMRAQAEMAEVEAAIQKRVEAAMEKAVMDAGRDQVVAAVAGDELALGFARVCRPDACYFCVAQAIRRKRPSKDDPAGFIGRPGVYKSRGTAGGLSNENFTGSGVAKFHNNCHCVIVPVFSSDYSLESHIADLEALYLKSTENSVKGEYLNDFRKALEAVRAGEPLPTPKPSSGPAVSGADRLAALNDILAGFGK